MNAPYFQNARLLIAADCTAFAFADFHRRLLPGRILLVCCPKLDDTDSYYEKLVQILSLNDIRDVEVVHMEVPCCFALRRLVEDAVEASGKDVPLTVTVAGIQGELQESTTANRRT